MSPKIVDKEEKKRAILEAAVAVFAEKGFHKTKMAVIADKAGIGKGTVYEYFKNKEALFMDLFAYMVDDHLRMLSQEFPGGPSPKKRLEGLITATFEAFGKMETIYNILIDLKAQNLKGEAQAFYNAQFSKLYREFRIGLGLIIKEGINDGTFRRVQANQVSAVIIAVMEGIMHQWMADREAFTLKDIEGTIKKMVMRHLET